MPLTQNSLDLCLVQIPLYAYSLFNSWQSAMMLVIISDMFGKTNNIHDLKVAHTGSTQPHNH